MEAIRDSAYILCLLSFLFGCKRYNTSDLEKLINLPLSDKIEFLNMDEQWNDFNGNGEKVVVFKIKSKDINVIVRAAKENDFKTGNTDANKENFTARERKYIKGNVLYKTISNDNEIESVVVDSANGIITYYIGIQ